MVVDLKANEMVKMAADVQHLSENDEVKGKLILTNQRLYSKPLQTIPGNTTWR